jgi:hypothetical protein
MIGSHLSGVNWWWVLAIGLETFVLSIFVLTWLAAWFQRSKQQLHPQRGPLEESLFDNMRQHFICLPWAQKVCMKLLCARRASHQTGLVYVLGQMGFGNSAGIMEHIVTELSGHDDLVFLKPDGTLIPNPSRAGEVEEIVAAWNFEF